MYSNCPKESQFSKQQVQSLALFPLLIRLVETNIAVAKLEKFSLVEEAPASNIFLGMIYITIPNLLGAVLTTTLILDSDATKHVSGFETKLSNLVHYRNFVVLLVISSWQ